MFDYKKIMSKYELDTINNQITYLRTILYQLSAACNDKRNEFAYLHFGVQALEGYIYGLKSGDSE